MQGKRFTRSSGPPKTRDNFPQVACEAFDTGERGTGVRVLVNVPKGTWVIVYRGELLEKTAALAREAEYQEESQTDHDSAYMYLFKAADSVFAIDATHSDHISRFINHSREKSNIEGRLIRETRWADVTPFAIAFVALRDISAGEELLFDYRDRRADIVANYPWLAK